MKIKKGDTVQIIAGKDKGERGEVLRVSPRTNRVVVQGLNIRRKHQRATPRNSGVGQTAPEILEFEGAVEASNVMLVCPKCGEIVRVGHQRTEAGLSARVCRSCKVTIDG